MPMDPYAALQALLRAEAARTTHSEAPPTATKPERDAADSRPREESQRRTERR